MTLESNNSANEVFSAKSSRAVMDAFWKSLGDRMAVMGGDQGLLLLQQVKAELVAEEGVDAAMCAEITELLDKLSAARFSDEIRTISARLVTLMAEHFKARSSVSAVHEFSTACREQLLATALSLAVDILKLEGLSAPAAPYALLSFGNLGRRELRMNGSGSLMLVFEDGSAGEGEYFQRVALRLEAILIDCNLLTAAKANGVGKLWHGSVSRWLDEVESGVTGTGEIGRSRYSQTFEMVADSRCLCGDCALASLAIDKANALLHGNLNSDNFRYYAKRVANMPVALGLFGRFKTARTGKHRGELSLEDLAIAPLVAAVRILAVHEGITATATAARIWSLLNSGSLSVSLADRLLTAFQNFIRHQIELEISGDGSGKRYFDPDVLGDDARERLKEGLEDIGTLQRLVYQQIVEVD
jgi:signal-transduction protein with cAMP-binding, CBS, and nucleotidyltransferase domain